MADQEPKNDPPAKADHEQHEPLFEYARVLLRTPGTGRTMLVGLAKILAGGTVLIRSWASMFEHALPAPPLHVTGYDFMDSATRSELLKSSGLSLLAEEAAIHAALDIVKAAVNAAIGFALILGSPVEDA